MKKQVIIFSIIVIVILIILQLISFFSGRNQADGRSEILTAIRDAGLTPVGVCQDKVDSITGDLNWAMMTTICESGGYDIGDYIDKKILISSCPIQENYVEEYTTNEKHPLQAWVLSDKKILCVYTKADRSKDKNPPSPGIYPVNDQFIKK